MWVAKGKSSQPATHSHKSRDSIKTVRTIFRPRCTKLATLLTTLCLHFPHWIDATNCTYPYKFGACNRGPSLNGKYIGGKWKLWQPLFSWVPKSLWTETAGMKLKDACSLEEKLWQTWASLVAQMVKRLPAMWETWVQSLSWKNSLEKEMATLSSILAWRIPWTEGPDRLYYPWGRKESDMTEHTLYGKWKQWQTLCSWAAKWIQMFTADMKLKDAWSLEEKLWQT